MVTSSAWCWYCQGSRSCSFPVSCSVPWIAAVPLESGRRQLLDSLRTQDLCERACSDEPYDLLSAVILARSLGRMLIRPSGSRLFGYVIGQRVRGGGYIITIARISFIYARILGVKYPENLLNCLRTLLGRMRHGCSLYASVGLDRGS